MRSAFLFILLTVLAMAPVQAHKVVASVWTEGEVIAGEIGFSNGEMAAAGIRVEVFGPDGVKLGETTTHDEGLFRFTPTQAINHTFRANLGAGHVAEVTLAADELPVNMARNARPQHEAGGASPVAAAAATPAAMEMEPALAALIAEAVRREVNPLRRELAAYQQKNSLQTILGGLGYICGIFGLAFFVYGRQNRKA